jgi:hypothetical protein
LDGRLAVQVLAAPLGCLAGDACRPMRDDDSRLDLIAVLAAGAAATRAAEVAVGEEIGDWQGSGVQN